MPTSNNIPNLAQSNNLENFQDSDQNLESLQATYLTPIDALRSKAQPILSNQLSQNGSSFQDLLINDFNSLEVSNSPYESRANAFYRMLGFPVMAPSGDFYNPGFDPNGNNTLINRNKVNSALYSSSIQNLLYTRERKVREFKTIFSKQDISSTCFAIFMRDTFPFAIFDQTKGPLEIDLQFVAIKEREDSAFLLSTYNTDFQDTVSAILDAGNSFKNSQHIIKPFIVDPRIENTITPNTNKIAVPFLKDKNALQITKGNFLNRPGIELILRQRIENLTNDSNFLKTVQNLLSNKTVNFTDSDVDLATLRTAVSVLSDSNDLPDNVQSDLSGTTQIQTQTVIKLIKSIKVCLKELVGACTVLDKIKMRINWAPLPSQDGPITGSLGASLSSALKNANVDLENKITQLKIKKLNNDRQLTEFANLGDFASPFVASFSTNTESIDDKITDLTNYQTQQLNLGMKSLQVIELVKGEVAGLGLIDILAIYISLWSVDLDVLISLLDDISIERMYNYNKNYQSLPELIAAKFGIRAMSGLDALKKIQDKIFLILQFADNYINNNLSQAPNLMSDSFSV